MRRVSTVYKVVLVVVAAAGLLGSPARAQDSGTSTPPVASPSLGGFQGIASAAGLHATYAPQGLLPTGAPVDLGAPDALATIASGPSTFARAAVLDPGDLLANPDALLSLASADYPQGTIPPWPLRISATSGIGEPSAESHPAPGLDARVHADQTGSHAVATLPATEAPAILRVGSMVAIADTATDGATVSLHARSTLSDLNLLGVFTIGSLVTDVTATADGAETKVEGGTTVVGAALAGTPVTIDADGIHVPPPSGSSNPILGGILRPVASALNELLEAAGIKVTVVGPVEQEGETVGRLTAAGLRIDLDFSDENVPGLQDLFAALPPLESPIPGAPSPEDLIAVARARHLTHIEVGRGIVSLSARPTAPPRPVTPVAPPSFDALAPSAPTTPARVPATPPATPEQAAPPVLQDEPVAFAEGAGIGAIALVLLLLQPIVGHRLAQGASIVLAGGASTACSREDR